MKKTAVFPGSFDPVTIGHIDIINRGLPLFDKMIIGIGINSQKNYLFPLEKRIAWLQKIFEFESDSLIQFNLNALKIVLDILKTEKAYSLNNDYVKIPLEENYREKFSAKKETEFEMEEYYQTFSDKLGFEKDLSILDLICNKGPETLTYLKNIQTK